MRLRINRIALLYENNEVHMKGRRQRTTAKKGVMEPLWGSRIDPQLGMETVASEGTPTGR